MAATFRILTSDGRGAIAVVRVQGPDALSLADAVFRPHRERSLSATEPGRLRLGRVGAGVGDEVVAVRIDRPTPTVEIQCHGGGAAVAAVVRALEGAGAELALQDGSGLSIPEWAMEDLARAPTLKTAEILLDQAHGALNRSLEFLLAEARAAAPVVALTAILDDLIRRAEIGTRLLSGWKVVIAGRPNVGKSRLFNAIAGFERSIVNPRAGVTRDVVSVRTAIAGWPVDLRDTAGERESGDAVENLGIARARQERREADLVLLVLDRSNPLQPADRHLLGVAAGRMIVANKCDLPPAWSIEEMGEEESTIHRVSAENGDGIEELIAAIGARLVPDAPVPGSAVPFRSEHLRTLIEARHSLKAGGRVGLLGHLESIGGCAWAGVAGTDTVNGRADGQDEPGMAWR